MKKYFAFAAAVAVSFLSVNTSAALITYTINANPNPQSLETLTLLTYDPVTSSTSTVSDQSLYGNLFGNATFSLNTSDLGAMTKFYRSPDINDFYIFIDGANTSNHVLANQVSAQNTTFGLPIAFNRSSDDSDIYTSIDSYSDSFSLNMQINNSTPLRTYGSDGSYTDDTDYFYTSLYFYGNLGRSSFEDTLLVTGINGVNDGGYVIQGHYHYTHYFNANGDLLKADTSLNMQQIAFGANELSVNIEDNTTSVPEPHIFWLMSIGLLALGIRQKRK